MLCNKCEKPLPANDFVVCGGCQSSFHYDCSVTKEKWTRKNTATRKKWKCDSCCDRTKLPTGDDKKNTDSDGEGEENLTDSIEVEIRNQPGQHEVQANNDIDEIKKVLYQIKQAVSELPELKREFSEVVKSLNFAHERIVDLQKENDALKLELKTTNKKVEELDQKITNMAKIETQVKQVEAKQNDKDQYERNRNLEIANVATCRNEVIEDTMERIAHCFGVPNYDFIQIDKVHRLPAKKDPSISSIIVQFKYRHDRDHWLNFKKKIVTNDACFGGGNPTRIFLNEQMTPYYRQLFWKTKEFAKENELKFVWFKDGKLRVRRDEGSKEVIIAQSEKDLLPLTKKPVNLPVPSTT